MPHSGAVPSPVRFTCATQQSLSNNFQPAPRARVAHPAFACLRGIAATGLLCLALTSCGGGDFESDATVSATSDAAVSATAAQDGNEFALAGGIGVEQGTRTLEVFHDRLALNEKLTSIKVCAGGYVHSIQMTTDRGIRPVRGGPGGTEATGGACHTLTLAAGETIVRVFGSAGEVVDRLGFATSTGRRFGPYGGPGGLSFAMSVGNGGFRGLSGANGTFSRDFVVVQVNLIGDLTGGDGGAAFIDRMLPDERVTAVTLCYRTGAYVQSIQLRTNLGLRAKHGSDLPGIPCSTTQLEEGEHIAELFGTVNAYVQSLGYMTTRGRRIGPFGGSGGTGFSQTVLGNTRFAGWFGRSGGWLDQIGLMTQPAGVTDAANLTASRVNAFADQLPPNEVVSNIEICTVASAGNTVVRSVRAGLASGRFLPRNGGRRNPTTPPCNTIELNDGEFVTEMFGRAGSAIDSLGLRTSNGREFGPYGGTGGVPFLLRNPSTQAFLGFAGRFLFDRYLTGLDFAAPDLFAPMAPADINAGTQGWWGDVAGWPINAIHASVLGDGRVMSYGTNASGTQGAQFIYDIWNPAQGAGYDSHLTLEKSQSSTDVFCSAQTLLANGQLLLAGGDNREQNGYNAGVRDVNLFTPSNNALVAEPVARQLVQARWYASQTMLPSGRILLTGGRNEYYQYIKQPELYTPGVGWTQLTGENNDLLATDYPRVFVPSRPASNATDEVYIIPPGSNAILRMTIDANGRSATYNTGVTLPERHNWQRPAAQVAPGKVLVQLASGATALVQLPTVAGGVPVVSAAGKLSQPRLWSSFTTLPNGEVLATGGSRRDTNNNPLDGVATFVEIWNPATKTWRVGASELRPRLYHSTAVLLPDGRVLSAGGGAPGPISNLNAQPYSPPYLFRAGGAGALAARPTIAGAPATLAYGRAAFTLQTPQAATVQRVTLTRLGSVTHSFDFDSRFIELQINPGRSATALSVNGPDSNFTAPPGQYLLTLIDNAGVPSVSKVVTLY